MLLASIALASNLMAAPPSTVLPQESESQVSRAVDAACRWLATHQDEDGRWDSDGFMKHDGGAPSERSAKETDDAFWDRVLGGEADAAKSGSGDGFGDGFGDGSAGSGAGGPRHDVGVTGLALLALMADGHTPTAGAHKLSVARGVEWLVAQQDADTGRLGSAQHLTVHYDHAIGTLALARAFAVTRAEAHRDAVQRAVDYILAARNPYGAWRYEMPPNGDNDSSVTTWMVLALRAAEEAGATVDTEAYTGALNWFDQVTDLETGRVGYDRRGSRSSRVPGVNVDFASDRAETLTAGALLCKLRLGADARRDPRVVEQVKLVLDGSQRAPKSSLHDAIWLHWGTAAMAEIGSRPWSDWSDRVAGILLATQEAEADVAGSWAPSTAWGYATGRVGTTALIAASLSSFERAGEDSGSRAPTKIVVRDDMPEAPAASEPLEPAGVTPAESIHDGLEWLAAHQDEDGKWDCNEFFKHDAEGDRTGDVGDPKHDVGVTGLALLAFLGDGHTPTRGKHKDVVQKGIQWLLERQDPESGLFGEEIGHTFLYNHAIGTLAICETYFLDRSITLKPTAQRAVNYICRARNPYGVWRYDVPPTGDNDTAITAWMVMALKSADEGGLAVDRGAYQAAIAWFDEMTDPATGRVGYTEVGSRSSRVPGTNDEHPTENGEALTAAALLCRFMLGQDPAQNGNHMQQHADLLLGTLPSWNPEAFRCDMYYWYYGTFAMFQMGGKYWKEWNQAMRSAVLDSQRRDGAAKGSWDPVGPWGYSGGRVYSTALMLLSLEAYFRYSKVVSGR